MGDNCLVLQGVVAKHPLTHRTPVGLSITRFTLAHESRQREAGIERPVRVRLLVMASGEHSALAQQLTVGQQVRVSGFVETKRDRQGSPHVILNAMSIEQIIED